MRLLRIYFFTNTILKAVIVMHVKIETLKSVSQIFFHKLVLKSLVFKFPLHQLFFYMLSCLIEAPGASLAVVFLCSYIFPPGRATIPNLT